MLNNIHDVNFNVHCRTGSLEKFIAGTETGIFVHCRTGSLENFHMLILLLLLVHCRTGSLEIR